MRITVDDVRKAGICVAGARQWFPAHGLNFADFLKNGIDSETFLASGDSYARLVVDRKMEREQTNG